MTVAAMLVGAAIGAGTAAAMGGDPKKGAMYGAVGGGIGGVVAPASQVSVAGVTTAPGVAGGAVGGGIGGVGSTVLRSPKGLGSTLIAPTTPPPSPMTVGYASQAEKQRRQRRRGYGSTIVAGGQLGVASTQRKQILG